MYPSEIQYQKSKEIIWMDQKDWSYKEVADELIFPGKADMIVQ